MALAKAGEAFWAVVFDRLKNDRVTRQFWGGDARNGTLKELELLDGGLTVKAREQGQNAGSKLVVNPTRCGP